jgi:hypothetical protein
MSLQVVGRPPGGDLAKCKPIADNAGGWNALTVSPGRRTITVAPTASFRSTWQKKQSGPPFWILESSGDEGILLEPDQEQPRHYYQHASYFSDRENRAGKCHVPFCSNAFAT